MSNLTTLTITILLMGGVTYAVRLSMFLLVGRVTLPDWLMRALNFVPVAVLTAIVTPELLLPGGQFDLSLGNARLLAGIVAIFIAWRTRNVILTVIGGMGTLWLLQAVLTWAQ